MVSTKNHQCRREQGHASPPVARHHRPPAEPLRRGPARQSRVRRREIDEGRSSPEFRELGRRGDVGSSRRLHRNSEHAPGYNEFFHGWDMTA